MSDAESESNLSDEYSDDGYNIDSNVDSVLVKAILNIRDGKLEETQELLSQIDTSIRSPSIGRKEATTTLREYDLANLESAAAIESDETHQDHRIINDTQDNPIKALEDIESDNDIGLVEIDEPTKVRDPDQQNTVWDSVVAQDDANSAWLAKFFAKNMWDTSSNMPADAAASVPLMDSSSMTVRDLKINDDEDAEELEKSELAEFEYNHRFDVGRISHPRTEGLGLDKFLTEGKRAKKRREAKEAKEAQRLANLEQEKKNLITITKNTMGGEITTGGDEEFPDDQEWIICDGCSTAIQSGKRFFDCQTCDYSLCRSCQSTVKHDHPLRKVKNELPPPSNWRSAIKTTGPSREEALADYIISSIKFEPDEGFKYLEARDDNHIPLERLIDEIYCELPDDDERLKKKKHVPQKKRVGSVCASHKDKRRRTGSSQVPQPSQNN